jgi:hypothetical protein
MIATLATNKNSLKKSLKCTWERANGQRIREEKMRVKF